MGNKNTKQKFDGVTGVIVEPSAPPPDLVVSNNISRGGAEESNIQGCLVFGCTENHNKHYCRVCKSIDSDHFSHTCRRRRERREQTNPALLPLAVVTTAPVVPVVMTDAVLPN